MTDFQLMLMAQEGSGPVRQGRFFPYDDATGKELRPGDTLVGNLTIGYGGNLTGRGLSKDDAQYILNNGCCDALDAVRHCFSCYDQLSRPRQLVLLSMAFNLGQDRLSVWTHFIGAVHRGAWEEAADHLLDSKAAKKDAPARYAQLATMMRSNVSPWV